MSLSQDLFLGLVPNNSAVLLVQQYEQSQDDDYRDVGNEVPQELLCQSALLRTGTNCNARWLDPSNSGVGQCVRQIDSEKVEEVEEEEVEAVSKEAEGLVFNSVRLDLKAADLEEGVYTCIIEDENRVEQKLLVGVYQRGTCST